MSARVRVSESGGGLCRMYWAAWRDRWISQASAFACNSESEDPFFMVLDPSKP